MSFHCDIQIETHGAKFAIKVFQQSKDDRILRRFENSKSIITRRLLADSGTFDSLSSYSQDSMKKNSLQKMKQPIEELESLRQLRISGHERRDSAKTFDQGTHKKDGTTLNPTQCSLQLPVPYWTMSHSGLHMHVRRRIYRALFIQMPLLLKIA